MATKKETEQQKRESRDTSAETTSSKATNGNGGGEFDVEREIDELVQTLQGDLTSIDPEDALSLIDQWHSFLSKSKKSDAKELAGALKDLQKMLKGSRATDNDISEALIHVGEQTSELAGDAEKGVKQPVQKLGKQLRKVGTSIAQAKDQEYHEQLDSLLEKTEDEDLTSLDVEAATETIDFWYDVLNKVEGEQFKPVASSLKSLKQALSKANSKPKTIAKALAEVGEQTKEVASEAPRGFKGIIQKLGKRLTAASESLTDED